MALPDYLQIVTAFFADFAPIATAAATVALVIVTVVLAKATKRMAMASSQPLVTATIEPNVWSIKHCDFVVENSGNAPAYDVKIQISPEPIQSKARGGLPLPLQAISILRPGQKMSSFLTEAENVLEHEFRVEVRWKRNPSDQAVESIAYDHRMPRQVSRLGAGSPEVQVAEQLKKLREDWRSIATGSRILSVKALGKSDREEKRTRLEERIRRK